LEDFCKDILRELSQNYDVIGLSSPGPELEIVEKREGVRTIAVPMERRISPVKDFISLLKMIRVFRKERPDMVHSMTPKAGLLCMMAGKLTGSENTHFYRLSVPHFNWSEKKDTNGD